MDKPFSVKDSVNLPRTDFKIVTNLVQNEPKMLQFWESIGLYEQILRKNEGRPLHPARQPAVRQRQHPPGHRAE